jgi:hypothetical protein
MSADTTAQCGTPAVPAPGSHPYAAPVADDLAWPAGAHRHAGHVGSTLALSNPRYLAALDRKWTPAELWVRSTLRPRHASAHSQPPVHGGIWQPALRQGRHAGPEKPALPMSAEHDPTLPPGAIPAITDGLDPKQAERMERFNDAHDAEPRAGDWIDQDADRADRDAASFFATPSQEGQK